MIVELVLKPLIPGGEWTFTAIFESADIWLQIGEDVFSKKS